MSTVTEIFETFIDSNKMDVKGRESGRCVGWRDPGAAGMKVYMVVNICYSPGKIAAIFDKRINASRYIELLDYPYEWAVVSRKLWTDIPSKIQVGQ